MCCRRRGYTAGPENYSAHNGEMLYTSGAYHRCCCGGRRARREPILITGVKYAIDAYKNHQATKAIEAREVADIRLNSPSNHSILSDQQQTRTKADSEAVDGDAPPSYEVAALGIDLNNMTFRQGEAGAQRFSQMAVNKIESHESYIHLSQKHASKLARKEAKQTAKLERKAEKYARKAAKRAAY